MFTVIFLVFSLFCETQGQDTQTQGVPLVIQVLYIKNWSLVGVWFFVGFFLMLVVVVSFPLGEYNL